MDIVNVGYRSTNYWVVGAAPARLLVDIGWPGTLGTMKASLKRADVPLREIRYALATHYHIDHAGLAEELKREGVPLLVLDVQVDAIPLMKTWTKPVDHYVEITLQGNVTISFEESRALLRRIGIAGEVLHTPGHSQDSVSLLLDDGSAFTATFPPSPTASTTRWRSRVGASCASAAPLASTPPTAPSGRWTPEPPPAGHSCPRPLRSHQCLCSHSRFGAGGGPPPSLGEGVGG